MSHWKKRPLILGVLSGLTILVWFFVFTKNEMGLLEISFLDIGQGDAILIHSPTGTDMLVDAGPDGSVLKRLGEVMPFYDKKIDVLMITNPDKDHIAGFVDVLKSFQVDLLLEPATHSKSSVYAAVKKGAEEKKVEVLEMKRGMTIDLGGGATFQVLYPDRDVSGFSSNDGSVIGVLRYGTIDVLFTGDAPEKIEKYLVSLDSKRLEVEVLKVGHHGSRTSTSQELLDASKPTYAVISSGKGNSYGHPHPEIVERLHAAGIEIFSTQEVGTVRMRTDGKVLDFMCQICYPK